MTDIALLLTTHLAIGGVGVMIGLFIATALKGENNEKF